MAEKAVDPSTDVDSIPANGEKKDSGGAVKIARITTVGAVLSALIAAGAAYLIAGRNSSTETATGNSSPVSIQIDRDATLTRDELGDPATIKGTVTNLKPDQMVWIFNRPLGDDAFYPSLAPCIITSTTNWTCAAVQVGNKGSAGAGDYEIRAVVTTDKDVARITTHLLCYRDPSAQCDLAFHGADVPSGADHDTISAHRAVP